MQVESPMLGVMSRVAKAPEKTVRERVWDYVDNNPWSTKEQVAAGVGIQVVLAYYHLRTMTKGGLIQVEKREKRRNKDDRASFLVQHFRVTTPDEMAKLTGLAHKVKKVKPAAAPVQEPDSLEEKAPEEVSHNPPTPAAPETVDYGPVFPDPSGYQILKLRVGRGPMPESLKGVSLADALEIYHYLRPILG